MGDPAHARFVLNRATFFVGSPAHALPVILFQQALYTPI